MLRLFGLAPRPWIFAWLALLLPAWAFSFHRGRQVLEWVRQTPPVCSALDYSGAVPLLPAEAGIAFVTGAGDMAGNERFFCAQHELAPRVLTYWRSPALQGRQLAGGTWILAHFEESAARDGFLRELWSAAAARGAGIRLAEPSPGLLVLRIDDAAARGAG